MSWVLTTDSSTCACSKSDCIVRTAVKTPCSTAGWERFAPCHGFEDAAALVIRSDRPHGVEERGHWRTVERVRLDEGNQECGALVVRSDRRGGVQNRPCGFGSVEPHPDQL